jgi:hypothetical protein
VLPFRLVQGERLVCGSVTHSTMFYYSPFMRWHWSQLYWCGRVLGFSFLRCVYARQVRLIRRFSPATLNLRLVLALCIWLNRLSPTGTVNPLMFDITIYQQPRLYNTSNAVFHETVAIALLPTCSRTQLLFTNGAEVQACLR